MIIESDYGTITGHDYFDDLQVLHDVSTSIIAFDNRSNNR
jgi:hypothetical protein